MPRQCIVYGCVNIGTHRFPKDETRKTRWIEAIKFRNPNLTLTKHSLVCSDHFRATDFSLTPTFWHNYHTARKVLKKTAIPTVFPWNIASQKQPSPSVHVQNQDSLDFDPAKVQATYARKPPIAFAEEQPFMVIEATDQLEDPLQCSDNESKPIHDEIDSVDVVSNYVVECEFVTPKKEREELPKEQQLHDKSVQTIDIKSELNK